MTKKNHLLIVSLGLLSLIAITGAFLMSSSVSADNDSVIDQINLTVPTSCSIEGTGMTSHNASIVNGTYQVDIGTTTLKAFCNDSNGFAIYAVGYTNDTFGETYLDSSISSTYDIVTGTATSGNTSNWAMKLATVTSPTPVYPITIDNSFNNYHLVPSTYTKVAHRDSGTDVGTNATGSTLTTTYAAFISQSQPAGTYTGKVRYTLVHPASEIPLREVACPAGKICYNPNTALVEGQMIQQTVENNASVTLYASNFKRDGYGFAGWNTAYDYSGTFYGPNQTITAPSDVSTNGLSLYAVWVPSAGVMQGWNDCASLTQAPTNSTATLSSITALTDNRDNDTYAIARLADGRCWMIENLRLDDSALLTLTNTNNPSLPITNIYDSTNPTTSNHLSPTTNPQITPWCNSSIPACTDQSIIATNNTTLFTDNTNSNKYSYGNYYSWYSATAGHGKYGVIMSNTEGDVCPFGWHLPIGGREVLGEYGVLDIALGGIGDISHSSTTPTGSIMSTRWRSFPNNFVYSGEISGSSFARDGDASYWTSTTRQGTNAYIFYISTSSVTPGTGNTAMTGGKAVRCVVSV